MTSTEFTIGFDGGARNSSKVLKPPGGGSSDIFGLGGNTYATSSNNQPSRNVDNGTTKSRLFGGPDPAPVGTPVRNQVVKNVPEPTSSTKRYGYQKVHRNPITGEEIQYYPGNQKTEDNGSAEIDNSNDQENTDQNDNSEEKKPEKMEDQEPKKPLKNSIRVRAPPGGQSSGIFF